MLDRLIQFRPKAAQWNFAAVTQGKPGEAKLFCQQRAPGIACLADPQRNAYRAYGLGRISVLKSIFSAKSKESRAQALAHGHIASAPPAGQDVLQTAGVFLIQPSGRLVFTHVYQFAGDHPDLEAILALSLFDPDSH